MKKILMFLILNLFLVTQCFAAVGWVKTKPAGSLNPGQIDDAIGENNAALDLMLLNYQTCKIAYNTSAQITVTPGGIMVSDVSGAIRLMLANSSATTVTWADIDTGGEAASTTYYVYAIASATTDTVFTCKISTSASAPTGATYYKLIGSFYNDGSSNITAVSDGGPGVTVTATALPAGNQGPTTTGHEYFYLTIGVDGTGVERSITGYAAVGTAIPLPTGCVQANCHWIISPKFMALNGVAVTAFTLGIGTDRVVTMSIIGTNWVN